MAISKRKKIKIRFNLGLLFFRVDTLYRRINITLFPLEVGEYFAGALFDYWRSEDHVEWDFLYLVGLYDYFKTKKR